MNQQNTAFSSKLAPCQRQEGLSLIELMVSITIALVLLLALSTAFLNFHSTNREMAKSNAMIENGRFAIQILQNDVIHAGFWGTYVPQFDNLALTGIPGDAPNVIPDACLAYDATNWSNTYKTNLIGIPLQVSASASSACAAVVTNKKAQTDVLVVRHAETCVPGDSNCDAEVAGKLYFQSAMYETEISSSGAISYVLDTTGHTLHKRNGVTIAEKRRFISNIYYIRSYANSVGDGIPTLVRSQFDLAAGVLAHQAAVPIVEGIEGFKVYLGIDSLSKTGASVDYSQAVSWADATNKITPTNRGDGTPDGGFVDCASSACTPQQLSNVVAAKMYILARNLEPTPGYTDTKTYQLGAVTMGPFNDNYKRHVYSTTARIVNVSARREAP